MSRLELSESPIEKWAKYFMMNMNEPDRQWTENNVDLAISQRAATKE
jgi:hypothetical protein